MINILWIIIMQKAEKLRLECIHIYKQTITSFFTVQSNQIVGQRLWLQLSYFLVKKTIIHRWFDKLHSIADISSFSFQLHYTSWRRIITNHLILVECNRLRCCFLQILTCKASKIIKSTNVIDYRCALLSSLF